MSRRPSSSPMASHALSRPPSRRHATDNTHETTDVIGKPLGEPLGHPLEECPDAFASGTRPDGLPRAGPGRGPRPSMHRHGRMFRFGDDSAFIRVHPPGAVSVFRPCPSVSPVPGLRVPSAPSAAQKSNDSPSHAHSVAGKIFCASCRICTSASSVRPGLWWKSQSRAIPLASANRAQLPQSLWPQP